MKYIFYINLHLRDRLDIEFTVFQGEPMPEEAMASLTAYDAYIASLRVRHSY